MAFLKPSDELVISVALVAIEYGIFSQGTPNLADVRADEPIGCARFQFHEHV